ncbi:hypothetical protein BV898_17114 [Hypsibius exemplaris]|uniref:Uncharacterized protein n=1 Tax=Hypsibius exemplaris TaxID=2072580 RepID=A0A9X6RLQ4_HYPEX|nr:hypothetical protein BV898_17114 [Hypsibius exemplaris]
MDSHFVFDPGFTLGGGTDGVEDDDTEDTLGGGVDVSGWELKGGRRAWLEDSVDGDDEEDFRVLLLCTATPLLSRTSLQLTNPVLPPERPGERFDRVMDRLLEGRSELRDGSGDLGLGCLDIEPGTHLNARGSSGGG